ncbi:MAG: type I 3-dehydroquinate dehydratase [Planctomycetota bacterium]
MKDCRIGPLAIGTPPRVVGTLSVRDSLRSACPEHDYACDVVEVRLDEMGSDTPGWLRDCKAIEAAGYPVILTLRLAIEGGKWSQPDEKREDVLAAALDSLACIDVELTSKLCPSLCRQARELKKYIIVSSHDFQRTPTLATLKDVLHRILEIPFAIPKISTMVTDDGDVDTLMKLVELRDIGPACIIGMGSKGTRTRVLFPVLGSCLAYGYIDSPSAPGQLPASILTQQIRQLLPRYNQDMIIRKEIMECV